MEPERQQQLKQPLLQGEDPDEAIIRQRNEEMKRLGMYIYTLVTLICFIVII
jgi:hypothetical protein